jgi:uncharacterized protein (TIGR02757 family)
VIPLSQEELKELLESLYDLYNRQEFIAGDPVLVPHRYRLKEDIETAGFLSALLAWGGRKAIVKAALHLMDLMDDAPGDFIRNHSSSDLRRFDRFVYRTLQPGDLKFLISALQHITLHYNGLEKLFLLGLQPGDQDVFNAIAFARSKMLEVPHLPRSRKHLSSPEAGAAAKRINLFLRWMVRKDGCGVDFGLWRSIRPDQLICPLDVHSGNAARVLGLLSRKANDRKAAEELTLALKSFDPLDPVKYDFALFGYGIRLKWKGKG